MTSPDAVALVRLQQLSVPKKLREHTAAVDVADEQNGRIDVSVNPMFTMSSAFRLIRRAALRPR